MRLNAVLCRYINFVRKTLHLHNENDIDYYFVDL